jgi:hypothetical protein
MSTENLLNQPTNTAERSSTEPENEVKKGLETERVKAITEAIEGGDVVRANNLLANTPSQEGDAVVKGLSDETMANVASQISEKMKQQDGRPDDKFSALANFADTFRNDERLLSQSAMTEAYKDIAASGELHINNIARMLGTSGLDVDAIKGDSTARKGMIESTKYFLKATTDAAEFPTLLNNVDKVGFSKDELQEVGQSLLANRTAYEAFARKYGT